MLVGRLRIKDIVKGAVFLLSIKALEIVMSMTFGFRRPQQIIILSAIPHFM